MNYTENDNGQSVMAVGAPGSLARVKVEHPALIERLNALYHDSCDSYGRGVDRAIEMIRATGIRSEMETNNLLAASNYAEEKAGSVTSMVVAIASPNGELFDREYKAQLRDAMQTMPGQYGYTHYCVDETEKLAVRMLEAVRKGSANINSPTFRKTCKALGIKHTQKSIREFLAA